jgi:hypothetical protein
MFAEVVGRVFGRDAEKESSGCLSGVKVQMNGGFALLKYWSW